MSFDGDNKKFEPTAVIALSHDLDRRGGLTGAHAYSPEWETKTAISRILDIVLKPIGFNQQLREILDVIVSVSWFAAQRKGAIFVANSRRELVMAVQHDLSPPLLKKCAVVPFGRCLCGKAAEEKRILFRTCVDKDHEIGFPGMKEHGHYNIPLLDNGGEVIGVIVLYLEHGHTPHREEKHFTEMLGRILSGLIIGRNLQLRSEISRIRLQNAQLDMIHKLVAASEFRDNETGEHIKRLSLYAAVIGRKIGLTAEDVELLELAIPMHDIGKMGIADDILLKPGKLTPEEYAVMQQHPEIGAKILSGSHPLMKASREIALSHHEKWDGTGYPRGLSGEQIPLFGRICALVDVFDALTTKRPYKDPWPLEKTLAHLKEGAGSHFDPQLVESLTQCLPEILQVRSLYSDTNLENTGVSVLRRKSEAGRQSAWKAEYSVGIRHIDDQHRYLFDLIGRIEIANEENDSVAMVEIVLDMKLYAEVHFSDEEELMRKHGYPGLSQHMQLHQDFIDKTDHFLDQLEQSPLAVTAEISVYLSNWWVVHIQKADLLYARYFSDNACMPESTTGG